MISNRPNMHFIRNKEDMVGLWSTTSKGGNMLLWWDGLRPNGAVASAGKVPASATTAQSKKTQQIKFSNMYRT